MRRRKTNDQLLSEINDDPEYRGKHVIVIGGKVHATNTGVASSKLLGKLLKQYPKEDPEITYIPREDTLILLL